VAVDEAEVTAETADVDEAGVAAQAGATAPVRPPAATHGLLHEDEKHAVEVEATTPSQRTKIERAAALVPTMALLSMWQTLQGKLWLLRL
jgi:hypothetical protein